MVEFWFDDGDWQFECCVPEWNECSMVIDRRTPRTGIQNIALHTWNHLNGIVVIIVIISMNILLNLIDCSLDNRSCVCCSNARIASDCVDIEENNVFAYFKLLPVEKKDLMWHKRETMKNSSKETHRHTHTHRMQIHTKNQKLAYRHRKEKNKLVRMFRELT